MGNKYFKHHVDPTDPEYKLYRDACSEVSEMFGIDFVFLKRSIVKPDWIFGEDDASKFDTNRVTTLYIENFEQFEGTGDLFNKFGFSIDDQLILVVGIDSFRRKTEEEPFEGDLLYHPVSQKYFEISHVAKPQGFFQFGGGQMMYRLICTLFKYSHEAFEFDSNGMVDDIDDFMNDIGNNETDGNEQVEQGQEEKEVLEFDTSNVFGEK